MNKNLLRVAFIDLAMHRNTASTLFLYDILRERFEVSVFWVNSRKDFNRIIKDGKLGEYDIIICLQVTPSNAMSRRLRKPIVYVPMYDGESYNTIRWLRNKLQGGKVLSFSDKEASYLERIGIETLRVKYYVPKQNIEMGSPNKAFLWYRGGRFDLSGLINELFARLPIDSLIIRCYKNDLNRISQTIRQNKKLLLLCADHASDPNEYKALFKDCGVFVAPRMKEGIGMAFLEAMAMGKCVIANNDSTMNEYIQDKVNGVLIDFAHPTSNATERVDEQAVMKMQRNAFAQAVKGRETWENDEKSRILDFCSAAYDKFCPMTISERFLWWVLMPLHFCADVMTWLKMKSRKVKYHL